MTSINQAFKIPRERDEKPLLPNQVRFVEEYLKDPSDKSAAAARAGYSPEASRDAANRLLNDSRVQRILQDAQDEALDILGITAARVLQELWKIAGANPGDVVIVDSEGDLNVDPSKLVGEVMVTSTSGGSRPRTRSVTSKTVKPADKVAALTQIAKIMNMFPKEEINLKQEISFADMVINSFPPTETHPILDTTATPVVTHSTLETIPVESTTISS